MYSGYDYDVMKEDAKLFLENGADGVVFGFLHADGTVDKERTAEFVKLFGEKPRCFIGRLMLRQTRLKRWKHSSIAA